MCIIYNSNKQWHTKVCYRYNNFAWAEVPSTLLEIFPFIAINPSLGINFDLEPFFCANDRTTRSENLGESHLIL